MRLKYLTLQGFKTFAPRTDLHFGEGLTAIVGPNGSGKSNVADAVRWVLGEQSLLQLRAKKTEDLIFAGSSNRAPLGMAEVSITLDNTDRLIPLEFAEVTLTRRAFRTGENEYYLNRSRVRLRDIQEIAAALGQAYTVVGQGLVDAALSLRPEERRELFEEAAEIRGYFVQREDALRRLQKTEENTTRLNDLLTELEPQVRRMERQARQAEDYGRLRSELLDALVRWFEVRWLGAVAEHRQAKANLAMAEDAVARHKSVTHEYADRLHAARSRVADHRKLVVDLQESRLQTGSKLAEARGSLAVLSEKISSALRTIETGESELEQLEGTQATLKSELGELQAAETDDSAEIGMLQEEERQVAARLRNAEQEHAAATRELREARAERELIERTRLALSSRLDEAVRRHEQTLRLVSEAESAQHAAEEAVRSQEGALLSAGRQAEEAKVAAERAAQLQQQASTALADRLAAREGAEEEVRNVTREEDALHSRLARLDAEREAGLYGGVRAVLRAAESGKLKGVRGTVAQLVQVPSRYEAAVEAAVGGRLQEVVVERWEDAETAIALLKASNEGRATFLPVDTVRVSTAPPVPKGSGVVGAASDLVEYGPELGKLVAAVFGRLLIVETLASARELLRSLPANSPWTIATLDGEVVRPGGSVTGGSRNRRGEQGDAKTLLSRERQRRDLLASIEASGQRTGQARAELELCTREVARSEAALREADSGLQAARSAHRAASEHLADLTALGERARKELAWRESVLRDARRDALEAEAKAENIRAEKERAEQAWQPAGEAEKKAAARESEMATRYSEIAAATSEGRTRLAVLLESARNSAARRDDLSRRIAMGIERRSALTASIGKSRTDLEELQRLKSAAEVEIVHLAAEIEKLEARLAGAHEDSSRLDSGVQEIEREAARGSEALLETETELTRASVRCEHCLGTLDALWVEIVEELRAASADPTPDHEDDGIVWTQSRELSPQMPDRRTLGDDEDRALAALLSEMGLDLRSEVGRGDDETPEGLERRVRQVKARITRIGPVNPLAAEEHRVLTERHGYLSSQLTDLVSAAEHLKRIISELDRTMSERFAETFAQVNVAFGHFFATLFGGGAARLELTDPENVSQAGIEIYAQPPGKRMQPLSALSGGERALTAAALLFALLRVRPVPFCVLDEVDAALDESNVVRFRSALQELGARTQFIVVTHNRGTIEAAGTLYGVSMAGDGTSKLLSLKVDQAHQAAS